MRDGKKLYNRVYKTSEEALIELIKLSFIFDNKHGFSSTKKIFF